MVFQLFSYLIFFVLYILAYGWLWKCGSVEDEWIRLPSVQVSTLELIEWQSKCSLNWI